LKFRISPPSNTSGWTSGLFRDCPEFRNIRIQKGPPQKGLFYFWGKKKKAKIQKKPGHLLYLSMPKKKITFFSHPGQPHEDQILLAKDWTPLQILEYHEAYKAWHTKTFGETEAQKRTKGKKIVIWKPGEK
jgi:hypothetical protein